MDRVRKKLFLRLKMLGREKHPLRPDDAVPILHNA
jgi:hypothetical protein